MCLTDLGDSNAPILDVELVGESGALVEVGDGIRSMSMAVKSKRRFAGVKVASLHRWRFAEDSETGRRLLTILDRDGESPPNGRLPSSSCERRGKISSTWRSESTESAVRSE